MFKLGDRVRYIGEELKNRRGLNSEMYGTVVFTNRKNSETYSQYLVCFDEKYNSNLHSGYSGEDLGAYLESFFEYHMRGRSYELKLDRGWFMSGEDMVLLKIKKGNLGVFK